MFKLEISTIANGGKSEAIPITAESARRAKVQTTFKSRESEPAKRGS